MIAQNTFKLALLISAGFLISCASTNDRGREGDAGASFGQLTGTVQYDDPAALIKEGKNNEAAMLYLKIASKASEPERSSLQLKGIHLLVNEKSFEIADTLISEIDAAKLNTNQLTHYAFLNAKLSLNERNAEKSLQWLDYIKNENYLKFTSELDALRLMISIYELASDNKSAILTRIKLEPFLKFENEVIANQQAIVHDLLLIDEVTLEKFTGLGETTRGIIWLELAMLVKKSKNPFRLGSQLASWKELNPSNPVRNEIIAALAPQQTENQIKIDNIALLLPMSGPFKKPASAIRDGFIANYYAEDSTENRPTIRVYNSASKDETVLEAYQRAVNDGADIIVGPLRKKAVDTLAKSGNIQTPTLVLNRLEDDSFYSKNFYQFALSPEMEAEQTAQRAWADGHNRAAIIYPENKWGNRVIAAFKKEWGKLGGEVASENGYKTKKNDFSKPIKTLLAIDKSYQRKRDLNKLLRARLKFEPRRRQDIDFIFMAAFPRQARLIPPQLKFFHAGKLPIYSTSHSFSGKINRKKDRDLNSLIVGDMPWTLTTTKNNNTKLQIYRTWPNKSKKFNRFYAFGNDAYYVLNYLNWLRGNNNSRLGGQTGNLHMNESNEILRELTWAKFKRGKPYLLPATAKLEN